MYCILFFISGARGNEWITISVAVLLADKLMRDPTPRNCDVYVLPVANPDGFAFTQYSLENREWSKNRDPTWNGSCPGVDVARSFVGHEALGPPDNPCNTDYPGATEFSTVEARSERDAMLNAESSYSKVHFVMSLHRGGQFIMFSAGHTPEEDMAMTEVADIITGAIQENSGLLFPEYKGEHFEMLDDSMETWAKEDLGATYAFRLQLPATEDNTDVPPSEIAHIANAVYAGFTAALDKVCAETIEI